MDIRDCTEYVNIMEEEKQLSTPSSLYLYKGIPLHKVLSPPDHVQKLSDLHLKKGDVLLAGYPKSGEW